MYLLNPFKDYDNYENYDQVTSESNVKLNENFYLPIKWTQTQNREYELVPKVYTEEEAIEKSQVALHRYISELEKMGVEILENQVVTTLTETECITEGRLIVEEPARDTILVSEDEAIVSPTPSSDANAQ